MHAYKHMRECKHCTEDAHNARSRRGIEFPALEKMLSRLVAMAAFANTHYISLDKQKLHCGAPAQTHADFAHVSYNILFMLLRNIVTRYLIFLAHN
jgi:hypothetical protein